MRPAYSMMRRRNTYTQFSSSGDIFGVVASTTRRDICRPTGGQEWVEEKYPQCYKYLDVRRNRTDKSSWKFCRVGSFIDKNDVKFWLVSSFASAAAKLHYELSLEIQKYRLQCGRIYEIGVRIYEIMRKFWVDVAYGVQVRPHFWAYAFWSSGKPLFPTVDAYPSWMRIHLSRRRRRLYYLSRPPEAKIRCISNYSKSSQFDKNSLQIAQNR